jgi:hypothetical protein
MKSKVVCLALMATLVLLFAFSAAAPAAPNNASPAAAAAPAPAPAPAATPAPAPEPHPQIEDAIRSLHHAKEHLEHASHDFGGHRVEAIHAIDEAIHQLEICLKY